LGVRKKWICGSRKSFGGARRRDGKVGVPKKKGDQMSRGWNGFLGVVAGG